MTNANVCSCEKFFHSSLLLADAHDEQDHIEGKSDAEGVPSVAEQSHADEFGHDVEEIVGMAHRSKEQTALNALVGHDVEFHRPHISQFVHHIKKHDVGKEHHPSTHPRERVHLHVFAVGLIECTEIEGDVCQGEQERIELAVLFTTFFEEAFLVADRKRKRNESQSKKAEKNNDDVLHIIDKLVKSDVSSRHVALRGA